MNKATVRDWYKEEFKTLVTLGESITAGGSSSRRDRCWASRLAALISDIQSHPVTLINNGIGGNVLSVRSTGYEHSGKPAASERLDKHVIAPNPDLLILGYGINDVRCGTPLELFLDEYEHIIDYIRSHIQPIFVLLGPYFMTDFARRGPVWDKGSLEMLETYNRGIETLSKEKDCLFVDVLSAYDRTPWLIHSDGVHSNDIGHLVVANRIFEVLVRSCSGLAWFTKSREDKVPRWRDESVLAADYGCLGTSPGT